jgi:hypothetical protein
MAEINPDVKLCADALGAKVRDHSLRWRYYDGEHPIAFVNPKISEVIPNGVVFKENFCQVVINATRDRLSVQAWNHPDKGVSERMADLWKRTLRKQANMAHVATLTTGEAYLVIWPGQDQRPRAYYHDPRQAHIIYDENYPEVPRVACKTWSDGKARYLNLYYPDRIEHYSCAEGGELKNAQPFGEVPIESNTFGVIPVFHFRLNPRVLHGELSPGVLSIQDAINKLLNDLMVASEYSSFPQRYGIGNWSDTGKIPVGPGTFAQFPGGVNGEQPASVGTFATSTPDNWLKPIDNLSHAMSILSATPKHYFSGQAGDPSGEALQAMEAPLISKVLGYQEVLGDTWTRAALFCLKLDGMTVREEELECIWSDPHTVQPMSLATTRSTNVQAGIPIITLLRDEGWTEDQLKQLQQDKAAMQTQATPSAPVSQPRTPEQAAPLFDGVVKTPDMAGQLAGSGAITRAVNRVRASATATGA